MTVPFDALILAGGRGARLGGRDKAALPVAGQTLLERSLAAVAGARRVVVVGPVQVPDGVAQVSEDPPGGGPVAGIAAGVAALSDPAPWTCVLAVDQPGAAEALTAITASLEGVDDEVDAVCHRDEDGHAQWLLAAYRHASVRSALAPHGSGHRVPVGRLVAPLRFEYLRAGAEHLGDVDTWDDHARWERRLRAGRPRGGH